MTGLGKISPRMQRLVEQLQDRGYTINTEILSAQKQAVWRDQKESFYFHLPKDMMVFSSGIACKQYGKGGRRYSSVDLFGQSRVSALFLTSKTEPFVEYLETLFLKRNLNPDKHLRGVFTHLLHSYDLHWRLCCGKISKPVSGEARE